MLEHQALTDRVIGLAIEVHRTLGPGLLDSVYAGCLGYELEAHGIPFEREAAVAVAYKDAVFPFGFRADFVVAGAVLVEVKAVAEVVPAHKSQILTYLRMSGIRVGLLMNFHAPRLKDGLLRFIV